jgi:hypothetical protein
MRALARTLVDYSYDQDRITPLLKIRKNIFKNHHIFNNSPQLTFNYVTTIKLTYHPPRTRNKTF